MKLNVYLCQCVECGKIWEQPYRLTIEDAGVDCINCYGENVIVKKTNKVFEEEVIHE